MRRNILAVAALFVALFAVVTNPGVRVMAQNVACYMVQGGAAWNAGSGCTWTVMSGGILDVASGGALKIAGVDKTTALAAAAANPVVGVAASYKVARGETALDGSNPTDVATGLTTIAACATTIKTASAPGDSTHVITYTTSGATLSLHGWAPISGADPTLVASTGTDTVGWVCVGT